MRLLGIDYGRKRLGLALTDPLGLTAQPLGAVPHDAKLMAKLKETIEEKEVEEVVIGYPRRLSGEPGEMAEEVERFGKKLGAQISQPIHYWDERLTTAESERLLIAADVRRSRRKEIRDAMAAALILQGFLEQRSRDS